MEKKRSWFTCVKRLSISEAKSKTEKKSKRWRKMFGRFNFKQRPEIAAPQKTFAEATEEQRIHVLAVAEATAAAAEVAVAAANAAAEVARITHVSITLPKQDKNQAAVKIQSAYRGYLARKALSALKGVVKLQAAIRGEIARRRMITRIRVLQGIALTPSRIRRLRTETADDSSSLVEKRHIITPEEMIRFQEVEFECNKHRKWGLRLVPKVDLETTWLRKQESLINSEEMKRYSFSHRDRRIDEILEVAGLEKLATERLNSILPAKLVGGDTNQVERVKLRSSCNQSSTDRLNSPFSLPRRSLGDTKQKVVGDESSLPNSPVFPTYMAATQSALAKARSSSTPRQRLALCDTYSGQNTPHKLRLSSFNGEMSSSTDSKSGISQQRYE